MTVSKQEERTTASGLKDRLIGVGQMGGMVASMILQRGHLPARCVALDMDESHLDDLKQTGLLKILCDGEGNMRALGESGEDSCVGAAEVLSRPETLGGKSDWAMLVAGS